MAERKNLAALITTPDPASAPAPTRSDRSAKPDRPVEEAPAARPPAADGMTMRSWYMPKASADRLAALVDDVHFATRLPKHLIMGALVNVVDRHRAEVEAEARAAAGH
jgi:hypothetical protein